MNIGREDSLDEQIAALQEKVSRAKKTPLDGIIFSG